MTTDIICALDALMATTGETQQVPMTDSLSPPLSKVTVKLANQRFLVALNVMVLTSV